MTSISYHSVYLCNCRQELLNAVILDLGQVLYSLVITTFMGFFPCTHIKVVSLHTLIHIIVCKSKNTQFSLTFHVWYFFCRATYYFRKSGFNSTNSKKLPEIAKACEELCIHFLCEKVSMLFLLQVLFFPDNSTYLLIFRFLIKKSTTLLTMYFKYKTALQPYTLNYLLCLD